MDPVLEHFFSGSALVAVDAKGRLSVPAGIRQKIERRSDTRAIVLTRHPTEPCLTGFDTNYLRLLYVDNERRRLAEEERDPLAHHSRDRRSFGSAEEVPYDTSGRILLTEVGAKQVHGKSAVLGRICIQGNRYINLHEVG